MIEVTIRNTETGRSRVWETECLSLLLIDGDGCLNYMDGTMTGRQALAMLTGLDQIRDAIYGMSPLAKPLHHYVREKGGAAVVDMTKLREVLENG